MQGRSQAEAEEAASSDSGAGKQRGLATALARGVEPTQTPTAGLQAYSWNSTGKIGR